MAPLSPNTALGGNQGRCYFFDFTHGETKFQKVSLTSFGSIKQITGGLEKPQIPDICSSFFHDSMLHFSRASASIKRRRFWPFQLGRGWLEAGTGFHRWGQGPGGCLCSFPSLYSEARLPALEGLRPLRCLLFMRL